MKNDGRRKKIKNNLHYAMQIVMVSGLGMLLISGIVIICLLLFSDLFAEPLIKPSPTNEYGYAGVFEGISTAHPDETDEQGRPLPPPGLRPGNRPGNSETGNPDDVTQAYEDELLVTYMGGILYAGGQALADNFRVAVKTADGTEYDVKDYECGQLSPSYRLTLGDNVFTFSYNGMSSSVTLNAVSVRSQPYPPDYVLKRVDVNAAQEKIQQIENGTVTYEQLFSNIAFTGDSQIKALPVYNIISMKRIVAENGESYDFLASRLNDVVKYSYGTDALILHYGINTLSTSASDRQKRIDQYRELILRLKEQLPGTRIIVSGLFPVHYSIFGNQERFVYIIEYDYALLEMCMEIGVEYLSDNAFLMENQDFFGPDGLHLKPDFYRQYWLKNIILTMGV